MFIRTAFLLWFWLPFASQPSQILPATASPQLFRLHEGLRPLQLKLPANWSAADCGQCHVSEYQSWNRSRHRKSWSNKLLQEGFVHETQKPCVHCHAPLQEQAAEIWRNMDWYLARKNTSNSPMNPVSYQPEPLASEGITCVTCHWREGAVLSSNSANNAPHPVRKTNHFAGPELCKGCHEFHFPATVNGQLIAGTLAAQSTVTEWEQWRAQGGTKSCVDCHMPNGSHAFPGAHDLTMLRSAIAIKVQPTNAQVLFSLSSRNIGHHLPTGDIFRRITLEVAPLNGDFVVIHRIGRRYRFMEKSRKRTLQEDSSLRPGETREIKYATAAPIRWRLRYHYTSELEASKGWIPPADLVKVLAEGTTETTGLP